MPTVPTLVEELRALEESLWRPETRHDADWLERLLSPDFVEFCRFGHVYDRADIIKAPATAIEVGFPFTDFKADQLAPDVALVTYENEVTSNGATQRARRSSIWVRDEAGWKLKFQQATTLPDE